jgi:exodeoxyribonuclease III
MSIKLISYNVNGIRAAMAKGWLDWLKKEDPDIICLQETKIQHGQIDTMVFEQFGYHHFWHFAEKKGYSGVALLTKIKPDHVSFGINNPKYDEEGRLVRADFKDITLLATYFPSGTMGDVRQQFKMEWLEDFLQYVNRLRETRPKLIISGDLNICHKPIDINFPEKHEEMSGFLPEEREWFDRFIGSGLVDSFRFFNKNPNQYSWWSYRSGARAKNLGWRIDYNIVTHNLQSSLISASILSNVVHSDHCPVVMQLDI